MRAILPTHALLVNDAKVCLVDQRRCLESMPRSLAPQIASGDSVKLIIDLRYQKV